MGRRVILASGNAAKLKEIAAILSGLDMQVEPQSDLGVTEVEESGLCFAENAILKARNACEQTGLAAIADDSGIEVDWLNGAPGIHSSRYAGPGASDEDNLNKLLVAMDGVPEAQRLARFHCVMVYMRHAHDPTPLICDGVWEGRLLHAPRGDNGFGYDPIFHVPTHDCASAELPSEVKNRISHRAQALRLLLEALRQRYPG